MCAGQEEERGYGRTAAGAGPCIAALGLRLYIALVQAGHLFLETWVSQGAGPNAGGRNYCQQYHFNFTFSYLWRLYYQEHGGQEGGSCSFHFRRLMQRAQCLQVAMLIKLLEWPPQVCVFIYFRSMAMLPVTSHPHPYIYPKAYIPKSKPSTSPNPGKPETLESLNP